MASEFIHGRAGSEDSVIPLRVYGQGERVYEYRRYNMSLHRTKPQKEHVIRSKVEGFSSYRHARSKEAPTKIGGVKGASTTKVEIVPFATYQFTP